MDFRIADTFTDSLARLTAEEQKQTKTTAFDLQIDPSNPGMKFHRLNKAKDKNFWSIRVSGDLRIITHRNQHSLLLCYVAHHDKAYAWAERRSLQTHPTTGAAQLVEIRETIKEIVVPSYVEATPTTAVNPPLFSSRSDEELLQYGVPLEWLSDVRDATEDNLLVLADRLPSEAAEALLELATGGTPVHPEIISPVVNPLDHPDAQRRFRVMSNVEELERAFEFPWDKWSVFLHPEQRQFVEGSLSGPARVSGSAGTGKTVVALHRAVYLARTHPDARILLTTFSDTLARALQTRLKRLVNHEPRLAERIDVQSISAVGERLYKSRLGPVHIASDETIRKLMKDALRLEDGHSFTMAFLMAEWEEIVNAWQLDTWEAYRDIVRFGRKKKLLESHRKILWSIFEKVHAGLAAQETFTHARLFTTLAEALTTNSQPPYEYIVVDEAQDFSAAHLRFLAALGRHRPDSLFFAGDIGQRIFQSPFSWRALGVDIRGRSKILRINYRTSHQIRNQADSLLDPTLADADGNVEERRHTVSVFNGPSPLIALCDTRDAEIERVSQWVKDQVEGGFAPHECAVFVRSASELDRARAAIEHSELPIKELNDRVVSTSGHIALGTMHLAKGLEFRAVAVMACDDDVIPSKVRIEAVGEDTDLQEVYNTERHLLYVACTRARDCLLVTGVSPASEFLDDLRMWYRPVG
jgi:superfamily I DNA/RNA helicase/mRNA-degrading endonuclease RelE of RelBE toxin-antitoxin system